MSVNLSDRGKLELATFNVYAIAESHHGAKLITPHLTPQCETVVINTEFVIPYTDLSSLSCCILSHPTTQWFKIIYYFS